MGSTLRVFDSFAHVSIWFCKYLTPPASSTAFICIRSGSPAINIGLFGSACKITFTNINSTIFYVYIIAIHTGSIFLIVSIKSLIRPSNPGAKHSGSTAIKHWPKFATSCVCVPHPRILGPYCEPIINDKLLILIALYN